MFFPILIAGLMFGTAPGNGSGPPEVEARWWINNPPYRLYDDRKVVLYFFNATDKRSDAAVERLNRLAVRKDVVVIGLTSSGRRAAEAFAKRTRARMTIGAGSRSARAFGARDLPALLWIERRGAPAAPVELPQLERVLPAPTDAASQPADWGDLNDEALRQRQSEGLALDGLDADALQDVIESDDSPERRRTAVGKLWDAIGTARTQEFVEFADAQLGAESDPWVRGQLRYYLARARGNPEPQWTQSPSNAALQEYTKNRESPAWGPVREFEAKLPSLSPSALLDEFRRHPNSDAQDLLFRRLIVQRLGAPKQDDARRAASRAALLEIVENERDRSIRLHAVGGLASVCKTPDLEAASRLEALAEREPDLANLGPMMERTAQHLRRGD